MRLGPYLRTHWGLYSLAGAIAVFGLWLFGVGNKPAEPGARKAPPADEPAAPSSKRLTADSVRQRCRAAGVPASTALRSHPAAVKSLDFPPARKARPTLSSRTRGVLGLHQRLMNLAVKTAKHAPLYHRAAAGMSERFRFFSHLAQNRPDAQAWWQARQRRRAASRPGGATPGSEARAKTPSAATLALRARTARRNSLALYRVLTTHKRMRRYSKMPQAMLEYAELLLTPAPRRAKTRPRPKRRARPGSTAPRSLQLQLLAPRKPHRSDRDQALHVLRALVDRYPRARQAVVAAATLTALEVKAKRCKAVTALLQKLPYASDSRLRATRLAYLRAYANYHAGRCLLAENKPGPAATRLLSAIRDAGGSPAALRGSADTLRREAAILLAQTVREDDTVAEARKSLAPLPPALARLTRGLLVTRWIEQGRLEEATGLCTPPNAAPHRPVKKR